VLKQNIWMILASLVTQQAKREALTETANAEEVHLQNRPKQKACWFTSGLCNSESCTTKLEWVRRKSKRRKQKVSNLRLTEKNKKRKVKGSKLRI
jgi:hypothetical protein